MNPSYSGAHVHFWSIVKLALIHCGTVITVSAIFGVTFGILRYFYGPDPAVVWWSRNFERMLEILFFLAITFVCFLSLLRIAIDIFGETWKEASNGNRHIVVV